MKRPSLPLPAGDPTEALARRAYRAAGHLLLDYLLRRNQALQFFPMERQFMLPDRTHITVNGAGTNWGEITGALGSMLTVPQVLLAGHLAERLKFHDGDTALVEAPLVEKARHLLAAYFGHYMEGESAAARAVTVETNLAQMHAYVAKLVRRHWGVVEMLAQALILRRTLTVPEANELLRKAMLRRSPLGWLRLGWEALREGLRRKPARG